MTPIQLYTWQTPNGHKASIMLEETGLPYEVRVVDIEKGEQRAPSFLALNPNRTVPVLKDNGGEPLWETGAIVRYLSTRYGTASFWPTDIDRRTSVDKWAEWSKINIAMNFTAPVFWRVVRTAPVTVR